MRHTERSSIRSDTGVGLGRHEHASATGARVAGSLDARLLRFLLQSLGNPPVRVTLWTGETILPGIADPVAHVWIANRGSLVKLIADPELQFGEC
jgi:hypothetical protein